MGRLTDMHSLSETCDRSVDGKRLNKPLNLAPMLLIMRGSSSDGLIAARHIRAPAASSVCCGRKCYYGYEYDVDCCECCCECGEYGKYDYCYDEYYCCEHVHDYDWHDYDGDCY